MSQISPHQLNYIYTLVCSDQDLASFPRQEFAGDPVAVRLGKMSPGSSNEDFSTLGPPGVCAIRNLRVLGK